MIYIFELQQYRILIYAVNFKSCWLFILLKAIDLPPSLFDNNEISFTHMDF